MTGLKKLFDSHEVIRPHAAGFRVRTTVVATIAVQWVQVGPVRLWTLIFERALYVGSQVNRRRSRSSLCAERLAPPSLPQHGREFSGDGWQSIPIGVKFPARCLGHFGRQVAVERGYAEPFDVKQFI